jgi:hypothetical protein
MEDGSSRSVLKQSQFHRMMGDRADLALALDAAGALAYMRGDWTGAGSAPRRLGLRHRVSTMSRRPPYSCRRWCCSAATISPPQRLSFERGARGPGCGAVRAPFFTTMTLGWIVEGAGASPRLYFEETVAARTPVNAGQAQGYVLCNLAIWPGWPATWTRPGYGSTRPSRYSAHYRRRDANRWHSNQLGCLHRVRAEFRRRRDMLEQSLRSRHENRRSSRDRPDSRQSRVLSAAEGDLERGVALLEQAAGRLS